MCYKHEGGEKRTPHFTILFYGTILLFNIESLNFHREATNTEVLSAAKGFRENIKSKPIYSGHILDQCLENWDTAV